MGRRATNMDVAPASWSSAAYSISALTATDEMNLACPGRH